MSSGLILKYNSLLSLSVYSKGLMCLLLILLPSWGVLVAQLGYFIGGRDLFTSLRYFILFLLFCSLFAVVVINVRHLKISVWTGVLSVYASYVFLHFIGEAGVELFIEGVRHEIIFTLLGWAILLCSTVRSPSKFMPGLGSFLFFILMNGIVAIAFAIWQYNDIYLLEKLYRVPLSEINNVHLAVGERLTSTLVNPINFGAFMALFFLAAACSLKSKWQIVLLFIICTAFVIGSMSRLALLAHLCAVIAVYGFGYGKNKLASILLLIFFIAGVFLLITFGEQISSYDDRLARMYTLLERSTFEDNARLNSWYVAVKDMSFIDILWGVGAGASSPTGESSVMAGTVIIENTFITVYYQYGVIGLVLFLLVLFRFFYNSLVIKQRDEIAGRFLVGFVVVFFVMSFGNDFIRNLPFSFYYWYLYAVSELRIKGAA